MGPVNIGGISRLSAILRVLAGHGFDEVSARLFRREATAPPVGRVRFPSPAGVRRALEALGPSFIKLGQLLSTRADVLYPEYIEELRRLQDSVAPVPFDKLKQLMEAELNKPISEVFASFETESLAAASVAQVHRATLFSGEEVAVKVVRPGIARTIRQDIRLMYYFARKFERAFEMARVVGAVNIVKEFERTIFRELDMHIEAGNMEKFSQHFRDVREIIIPRVFWDLTTKSVLVMEYAAGVKMDDVASIREFGIEPRSVAMIGLRSLSRQLMDFGFFHADPHPGNTIVTPDGRVCLVDFGITGYLDEETMLQIAGIFYGYAEHDYDMVMNALVSAGLINEDMDLAEFRADLKDISEPFYGRSLQTISVKDVYDLVIQLVLKYRLRLPRNLLLLFKTLIQTEALGKILGSDANILQVMKPYARDLLNRAFDIHHMVKTIGKDARYWSGYLRTAPKMLFDILKNTSKGKQGIEIRHSILPRVDQLLEKGVNRITVGIIVAASTIAAALIMNSSQKIFSFSLPVLGLFDVSVTHMLGVVGYVIATILGIWLILSIMTSGKL